MLHAFAAFLVLQLAGEALSHFLILPVPGPVLGMALLFAAMSVSKELAERLRETANAILQHLSLLFVPAGVGVMLHVSRLAEEWLAIVLAVAVSTVLTIVLTALTIRFCMRFVARRGGTSE